MFGALLRDLRFAAGLSQEALAERARLSPGAVSSLERSARRAPQHQTLQLLIEALRLSPEDRERMEAAAAAGRRRPIRNGKQSSFALIAHNLPNLLTTFYGRGDELAELSALLRTRRLVTLLGTGGVGKTRLALETARAQLAHRSFTDGVWFIELGPLTDAGLIEAAIARPLGVRQKPDVEMVESLTTAIGERRMLLLIDNCEHVIDGCARVVERVLQECRHIAVLATTREALRLDGESILRLAPLSFDSISTDGPAMQLFADRLCEADVARYRHLNDEDRAFARTICERLDGVPLALELAAGRVHDLPLAQIALGLDERFELLNQGRRTASSRQQSLRGVIDWSYALLMPLEQQLFACLGLFPSTFSPEAAIQVCGSEDVQTRAALRGLIEKSLVGTIENARGEVRCRLLETVRAYALERLAETGQYQAYAQRFARYFCTTARAADLTYGRISHETFLASVEPELENFRFALAWTLEQGHDRALGAQLAGALGWCYRQLSLIAEGKTWCEDALADAATLEPHVAGRLHMALSFFYFNVGELQRAFGMAQAAAAAYRCTDRRADVAWALTQQVHCAYMLGRTAHIEDIAYEAVAMAREQDDSFRLAGALNALAITIPIERAADRLPPLEEAIQRYRAAGDADAIVARANLAEAYFASGNYPAALERGLEIVEITRRNRDRSNLAGALTNVAGYAVMLGDVPRAGLAGREALELVRKPGKTLNAMCALQHVGSVWAHSGNPLRAARLLGAANSLYADFGLSREFTETLLYERTIVLLRDALGEEELQLRLAEGLGWSFERAVKEALTIPAR
ncbi:MAG: helix-turn-helix domain-containing protein [Candidatus Baltobacteraceae bacterium]